MLPQLSHLEPTEKFRYSFLAEGSDGLVAGEYAKDVGGRLALLSLADGVWVVSSSRGDRLNGDLWVGPQGALVKHEGALPPGPEDLTWSAERSQLWGVSEHPGQRWVFAIDWPL
ncbi:MAG TPA: hypothetical protein VIJ11_11540 [Galbitalea sp.]